MQGALDEDESSLLLDLLRGVAQNLAVKGFTRVRVCFNSMPLALAARRLMTMNPFILRLDALGGAGLASDDEMVILVRPNNALNWNKVRLLCIVRCEHYQYRVLQLIGLGLSLQSAVAVHTSMLNAGADTAAIRCASGAGSRDLTYVAQPCLSCLSMLCSWNKYNRCVCKQAAR